MKIIIGLGNPGDQYAQTRHNVGFRVIDDIAEKANLVVKENKFRSLIAKNEDFILVKPQTYMNLSGDAVKEIVDFYKVSVNNILVICDELDIKIGQAKIKLSTSSGGHNGVKDIINKLNTSDFYRLKIGIGRPKKTDIESVSSYVLKPFAQDEEKIIKKVISKASEAVLSYVYNDINFVINNFNQDNKEG